MHLTLWMAGALCSFCMMAIGGRELSGHVSTFEILFFRSLIGLLVVSTLIYSLRQPTLFRTQRLKVHFLRNLFHFGGQYGWFLGIGLLPLVQVFAIEFTVPLWTALIAALFLHEPMTWRKSLALLLGLAGVAVIVRPDSGLLQSSALIVLAAAVGYAVAHTTTKVLAGTDKPLTILFYMCLIQLPLGLLLSLPEWKWPQGMEWLWLLVVGVAALTAHFCLTKAMQQAEVGIVVTLDFLRLPLIALVGMLLYGEPFEWAVLWGGLLMLAGNWLNVWRPRPTVVAAPR